MLVRISTKICGPHKLQCSNFDFMISINGTLTYISGTPVSIYCNFIAFPPFGYEVHQGSNVLACAVTTFPLLNQENSALPIGLISNVCLRHFLLSLHKFCLHYIRYLHPIVREPFFSVSCFVTLGAAMACLRRYWSEICEHIAHLQSGKLPNI